MAKADRYYRTEGPFRRVFISGFTPGNIFRLEDEEGITPAFSLFGDPRHHIGLWREEDMAKLLAWLKANGYEDI